MRFFRLALMLLPLAGCAATPQSLGITGPQGTTNKAARAPAAEPSPASDPLDNPDLLQSGTRYGPSYAPSSGSSGYWGYN
ncbi:MAG TPA: hypothetical protein VME47_06450 [Acetobacteraceae bacterium]|nr:hypothetical protein [Acetobacteraceae bacterium]